VNREWSYPRVAGVCTWLSYVVFLALAGKMGLLDVAPFANKLEEISFLAAVPAAIVGARALYRGSAGVRLAATLFGGYLAVGLLGLVNSRASLVAGLFQAGLELKFPAVAFAFVGLGMLVRSRRSVEVIVKGIKVLAIISLLLILLHIVAPGPFASIFPSTLDAGYFLLPGGGRVPRFSGAFTHPTQLGYFAGSGFGFFALRYLLVGRRRRDGVWALILLLLLLTSMERQETATALLLVPSIGLWVVPFRNENERRLAGMLGVGVGTMLLAGAVVLLWPYLSFVVHRLGLEGQGETMVARVVFYVDGFRLAASHFPLGSGFGSFGGYAAEVFHSPVYHALGFDRYWWYRQGHYMTDTFWPHVLGEAGWLGLGLYVAAILSFAWILIREVRRRRERTSTTAGAAVALYGFVFLVATSLTSAVLTTMFSLGCGLVWLTCLPPRAVVLDEASPTD